MRVTTTDIKQDYEVVKIVFAFKTGNTWKRHIDPESASELIRNKLTEKAKEVGADAVICARFNYHPAYKPSLFSLSRKQFEINGYGTAVKLVKK